MSQENWPGGTLETAEPVHSHLPIDDAKPRAGDGHARNPFEDRVRDLRFAAAPSPVRDPDASMDDPVVGINTRGSTHPVAATVRMGFEDVPNLGKKGPDRAPSASPDPLQSMESSPSYVRPTVRVTPGPWDETLLRS